jgi:molecular chaperone GrpE
VTLTNDDAIWDEAAEGNEAVPPAEIELTLEEQLAAAQAEAARNLDGWQRTQAEFANARKRFEKQRVETYINANAELVGKLVPLLDDFERALDSVPADNRANPWVTGMELVYRKMQAVLEEMNVQVIPAVGQPFDPNMHEALSQEASDEYDSGTVVREMRRGYRLGDRVIRPSLVTVAP